MFRARPRAHKYGAKTEFIDGIRFDSRAEAAYYRELKYRIAASEVRLIERQPKIYLTEARILLKPDFLLEDVKTGKRHYVDVKGMRTAYFQIKLRLWKHYGPGDLHIIKKRGASFETVEVVLVNPV